MVEAHVQVVDQDLDHFVVHEVQEVDIDDRIVVGVVSQYDEIIFTIRLYE